MLMSLLMLMMLLMLMLLLMLMMLTTHNVVLIFILNMCVFTQLVMYKYLAECNCTACVQLLKLVEYLRE